MTKKIEVIKSLHEIAQDEHVEFVKFREKFSKYCKKNESAVTDLFRYLRGIEQDLSGYLNERPKINMDRAMIIKVLFVVKTELEIVRSNMINPDKLPKAPPPVGKWTNPKIDLIVLIYAIKNSINNGNVYYKTIQKCFEYIFQVNLGNISNRVGEPSGRIKKSKTGYFENLIEDFDQAYANLSK